MRAPRSPWGSLGAHVGSRDNNFNLIRFVAATAVLFSHSFALSTGSSNAEPLRSSLGTTFGQIAVDVFFLTSGFLVTASLLTRRSAREFALARCLRIYPGLVVAVLMTTAVVGWHFTTLAPADFFSSASTWQYVLKNTTMITGEMHTLPGAFEHTPWRGLVNASLWTLPYELGMYFLLALGWVGCSALGRRSGFGWIVTMIAAIALGAQLITIGWWSSNALRLTAMFFVGSSLYVVRDVVPMSGRLFAALLFALLISTVNLRAFTHLYPLALPYLTIYLAYVPTGAVRRFNELGDCSYGLYIYAWPVQQMTAASIPGIGPIEMFGVSMLVTTALASLSWKLVEKSALALKARHLRPRSQG